MNEKTKVKSVDNTARINDKNTDIVQMMIWNRGHAPPSTNYIAPHTHHTQNPGGKKRREEGKEKKGIWNKSRRITHAKDV